MPNWKKVIVSGSDASLSNLNVTNAVTASYFVGDGSQLTGILTDPFPYTGSAAISGSLTVTGAGYFSGETILSQSLSLDQNYVNVGLIIEEDDYIYTKDSNSLRKLIGKTSDIIQVGQIGTSLIDGIQLLPGTSNGYVTVHNDGSEYARFQSGRFLLGVTTPTDLPNTLEKPQAEIEYNGYGGLYIHGDNSGLAGANSSSFGLVVSASNHTVTNGGASYGAYIEARSTTYSNTANYGVYAKSVRRGRAGQYPAVALFGHSTHTPITNNLDMSSDLVGVWSKVDFSDDSIAVTSSAEMYNFYGEAIVPANKIIDDYYGLFLDNPTVNGTITNNRYGIYQEGSLQSNYFAGNVGIGTTSPADKLDVRNGTLTVRDDSNVNYVEIDRFAGITMKGNGTASRGIQTPNTDALTFGTNATERMRITSAGNVGIGTSSPSYNLHVSGTSVATLGIIANNEGKSYLRMHTSTNEGVYFEADDGATNHLYIRNAGDNTHLLAIDRSSGNVGIGTSTPTERLHVSGNILVNDTITTPNNVSLRLQPSGSTGWIFLGSPTDGTKLYHYSRGDNGQYAIYDFDGGYYKINTTSTSGFNLQRDTLISGDLTVDGIVTAQEFHTEFVSASILYSSGSTKFGNTVDDIHDFTGRLYIDVSGSDTVGQNSALLINSTNNDASIRIGQSANYGFEIKYKGTNGGNNNDLQFLSDSQTFTPQGGTQWMNVNQDGTMGIGVNKPLVIPGSGSAYNGNVGIGTTSPTTKLHVTGIAQIVESGNAAFYGGNYVRVFNDQNFNIRNVSGTTIANISVNGNTYFNGGNVGIGNSSPATKLDVSGSVRIKTENPILQLLDDNTSIRYAALQMATAGGNWFFSAGDSNTGPGLANSDLWITRAANGSDNRFRFHRDSYAFTVYSGSSARVRLDADGNSYLNGGSVGIGTTSPQANLHVADSTSSSTAFKFFVGRDGGNTSQGLGIAVDDSGTYIRATQDETSTEAHHMTFDVSSSASGDHYYYWKINDTGRMWLNDTGLGIGNTSPQERLDVTGNIVIRGTDAVRGIRRFDDAWSLRLLGGRSTTDGGYVEVSGDLRGSLGNAAAGEVLLSQGGDSYANRAAVSSSMLFKTHYTGGSATDMAIVGSTGNVGIGTTNPSTKLEVAGDTWISSSGATLTVGDSSSGGTLKFGTPSNNTKITYASSEMGIYTAQSKGINFYTNGTNRRMVIENGGSIGFGVDSPSGSFQFRGGQFNPAYNAFNGVLIDSSQVSHAVDAYGVGIEFTALSKVIKKAAIVPVGCEVDNDTTGLAFLVSSGSSQGLDVMEGMRIAARGNVGIGVTAPTHKLTVAGHVSASAYTGSFYGDGSGLTDVTAVISLAEVLGTGNDAAGNDIDNVGTLEATQVTALGNVAVGPSVDTALGRLAVSQSSGTQVAGFALHSDNGKAYMYMSGSSSRLAIQSGFTGGGSILLNPDGTGNVGINTPSPSYGLHVNTDTYVNDLAISSAGDLTFLGNALIQTNNNSFILNADSNANGSGFISLKASNVERVKVTTSGAEVTGDLTVTGIVTAQEFHTEFVSASILYSSGSTKFGNSTDDLHSFTGSIGLQFSSQDTLLETERIAVTTTSTTVTRFTVATHVGAVIDYTVYNDDLPLGMRTGQLMVVADNASETRLTDTSTTDIGDTSAVTFTSSHNGTQCTVTMNTPDDTWNIRVFRRLL